MMSKQPCPPRTATSAALAGPSASAGRYCARAALTVTSSKGSKGFAVEGSAAATPDECQKRASRRDEHPREHPGEVEHPGCGEASASGGDLPGGNLELADRACVVPREHVMKVVEANGAHPARRVRDGERNLAELEVHPLGSVAAVFAEVVRVEVDAARVTERHVLGVVDEQLRYTTSHLGGTATLLRGRESPRCDFPGEGPTKQTGSRCKRAAR